MATPMPSASRPVFGGESGDSGCGHQALGSASANVQRYVNTHIRTMSMRERARSADLGVVPERVEAAIGRVELGDEHVDPVEGEGAGGRRCASFDAVTASTISAADPPSASFTSASSSVDSLEPELGIDRGRAHEQAAQHHVARGTRRERADEASRAGVELAAGEQRGDARDVPAGPGTCRARW